MNSLPMSIEIVDGTKAFLFVLATFLIALV